MYIYKSKVPFCLYRIKELTSQSFRASSEWAHLLVERLSRWFLNASKGLLEQRRPIGEIDEKMLEFAYHVVKKCWPTLIMATSHSESSATNTQVFIRSLGIIAVKVNVSPII